MGIGKDIIEGPIQKIGIAIRQLSLAIEQKGEYAAVRELRKQLLGYLKGLRGGASIRARIAVAESADEIVSALNEAFTEE
jgi:tRNA-dihydrouridine synthase B